MAALIPEMLQELFLPFKKEIETILIEKKLYKTTVSIVKCAIERGLDGYQRYEVRDDRVGKAISGFYMNQLQGCCGVAVSYAAVVYNFRDLGIGTILNKFRIVLAKAEGYGILLCTDVNYNSRQRKILAKNGWKDIYTFINPRTKNTVNISVIPLLEGVEVSNKDPITI